MNKYAIKLVEDKQLLYELIYNLNLVKLEMLKVYIDTHLKTGFIWFFKSPINVFILFNNNLTKVYSYMLIIDG